MCKCSAVSEVFYVVQIDQTTKSISKIWDVPQRPVLLHRNIPREYLHIAMKEQSACLFSGLDGSGKARGHTLQ
jgi:hypothetical protein